MRLKEWISLFDSDELEDIDIANFKKRNYMHFRDETLSAKVREDEKRKALENTNNLSRDLRNFVRCLLGDTPEMLDEQIRNEHRQMNKEDFKNIANGIAKGEITFTEETLEKMPKDDKCKLAIIVSWLSNSEVRHYLCLDFVVSTALIGYEKEIFVLNCIKGLTYSVIYLRIGVRLIGKGVKFEDRKLIPIEYLL